MVLEWRPNEENVVHLHTQTHKKNKKLDIEKAKDIENVA